MKTKKQRTAEALREEFLRLMDKGTFWYCRPTIDESDDVDRHRPVEARVLETFHPESKRPAAKIEYDDVFDDIGIYKNTWVVCVEDMHKYIFEEEVDAWRVYSQHLENVCNNLTERAQEINRMRQNADGRIRELTRFEQ